MRLLAFSYKNTGDRQIKMHASFRQRFQFLGLYIHILFLSSTSFPMDKRRLEVYGFPPFVYVSLFCMPCMSKKVPRKGHQKFHLPDLENWFDRKFFLTSTPRLTVDLVVIAKNGWGQSSPLKMVRVS